jgi:hypothetical protein
LRALEEYQTEKKKESRQDRAARLTTHATIWIAIFTAVTTSVGIAQWFILSGQLEEMRGSSADTRTLAEATKRSADAATVQATAMREQLTVMRGQLDEMRIAQRPWVSATPSIGSSFVYSPEKGASITIRYDLQNSGRSPATNVWIEQRLFPMLPSDPRQIEEMCPQSIVSTTRNRVLGFTIFPNEVMSIGYER